MQGRAGCLTEAGGPAEFKKCRDWFIYRGEMLITSRACQNSAPPTNQRCFSLHQELPELRNITSIILAGKEKVKCFPSQRERTARNSGWCAVCLPGAKPGQPGHCSQKTQNLKVR